MKSAFCALAVFSLGSATLLADSVNLSNGASWSSFSSVFNPSQASPQINTGPNLNSTNPSVFWNNWSTDTGVGGSHDMNIGYMLTGTGGWAGTDVLGSDSVATAALGGGPSMAPSDPTAFTFNDNTAQTYDVTLLGANSSLSNSTWDGTVYGVYYMQGNQIEYIPIYGPGYNSYSDTAAISFPNLPNGTVFGFYAAVCYDSTTLTGLSSCPSNYVETYYTNSSLNSGYITDNESSHYDAGEYNHFALFGLTSSPTNNYAIGFKDGPVPGEGLGDFNDVVIELTDPVSAPEPATSAAVATGLAALLLRRRFRKQ
jgi:hypothetical protein